MFNILTLCDNLVVLLNHKIPLKRLNNFVHVAV
jgi:hypothetical protein